MDNSQAVWRKRAKFAAIVDLVLLLLNSILAALITALVQIGVITEANLDTHGALYEVWSESLEKNMSDEAAETKAFWRYLWIVVGATALIVFVQSWTAAKLFTAAQVGIEVNVALAKARFYRIVSIIFLVFYAVVFLFADVWNGLFMIIWRTVCIFIVVVYIKELERLRAGYNAGPVCVAASTYSADTAYSAADTTNNVEPNNNAESIWRKPKSAFP